MSDYFHSLMNWISYNRGKVLGVAIALVMLTLFCTFGCVKTFSVVDTTKKVTQDVFYQEYNEAVADLNKQYLLLQQEAEQLQERFEVGAEDLDAKNEQLKEWLNLGSGVVTNLLQGNAVSVADVLPSAGLLLLGSLTAGSVYDSRKKDKVILALKESSSTTDSTSTAT